MPSTKPFVISYIARSTMDALRREADILTALAAGFRAEGFSPCDFGLPWGRVQPGQVAVEQMKGAIAEWPACLRIPPAHEPRPIRQRWLLDPTLHAAIHHLAAIYGLSLSDLVARMVQPLRGRAKRGATPELAELQFRAPPWVHEVVREKARSRRRANASQPRTRPSRARRATAPWPWRAHADGSAEAKSAYRQWLLAHHPDQGGDHDLFVRGKDDYEGTMQHHLTRPG